MWTKNAYQEQMLGYLREVETNIEQLAHSHRHQRDLKELYIDLDTTFEWLRRLIEASDADWEAFRYPVETSCDRLQRAFYRVPRTDTVKQSVRITFPENLERWADLWETAEMLK